MGRQRHRRARAPLRGEERERGCFYFYASAAAHHLAGCAGGRAADGARLGVSREKGESRAKRFRFRFRLRARLSRRASVDAAKGGLLESDALEFFVIQSALSCQK